MRHPSADTLLEHATGQLDLALRALVEAHLDHCPACHAEVAACAAPGGAWLAAGAGAGGAAPPPELWRRLELAIARPAAAPADGLPLPAAVRSELPPMSRVSWWRALLGGAKMAVLHDDAARGVKLMIGRMPPGKVFPRHEHLGFEQMVVLAGGYDDERGEFVAGDYAVYEPGSAHGPQTLDGDDCWILFRIDGPVRFRGWRGLVQRLAGG
jgi:putative transcriptional regulator